MKLKKKPQTASENYEEWVSTKICDDDFIQTFSEDILNSPKFVFSPTDSEFDKQQLYTTSQMLEMFRAGFLAVTRTDFGLEALRKARHGRVPDNPYRILRNMDVNDRTTFPFYSWRSVRTAASRLKAEFGVIYRVNKLARVGQVGDIEVTRLS